MNLHAKLAAVPGQLYTALVSVMPGYVTSRLAPPQPACLFFHQLVSK